MVLSDVMYRWRPDADQGARPANEYRAARRNSARISYRIAKKVERDQKR